MAEYSKKQARDWAWATMRGVANVVNPTFTADLSALNEKAIRHDVRKEIEYGFWGALLIAETATTPEEYIRFTQWAADEARGRLHLIFHASFNTLAQNISVARAAQEAGAELVLLAYPANFYARTSQDIYDYTKAFCDQVDIGVILFPVPLWGFERIHPAGMEIDLLRKLVDDVPNIVAIKAEGGMPTIGGFVETYKTLGKRVIVTSPLEWDGIPLASLVPIQFMGTSNYEFYGPTIPKMFASDAGGRVCRGDEAVLEDSSGTAGEPTGDVSAGRLQLSPSNALEISGLAARLQWRPVAAAHDAPGGSASAAAACRPRPMRTQPMARAGRRFFYRP